MSALSHTEIDDETHASPATAATHHGSRRPYRSLAVVGGILLLNALVLAPAFFFSPEPYSEVAQSPAHRTHYAIWVLCLLALVQLYARLSGLPRWATVVASVGVSLDACARFVEAFVVPFLAAHSPQVLDAGPGESLALFLPLLGSWVAGMIGHAAVALAGWRRRIFPRPAAVVLLLGALLNPAFGPLCNVLIGAALLWIGMRGRGSHLDSAA